MPNDYNIFPFDFSGDLIPGAKVGIIFLLAGRSDTSSYAALNLRYFRGWYKNHKFRCAKLAGLVYNNIYFAEKIEYLKVYKHIFFDLDRTLWDFDANSRAALTDVFRNHQLDQYYESPEPFISAYHKHNEILWNQYRDGHIKKELLRHLRFDLTLQEVKVENTELAKAIGEDYLKLSTEKTILFPYTHEILAYLHEKYPLYILTNGFKETQFSKMKNCDLSKYFKHVFTSETIGYNKPNPKIFQWALSSVNGRKEECLMIGDDFDVDIVGARNCGIDQVFFNPLKLKYEVKPSFEIQSLLELKTIL